MASRARPTADETGDLPNHHCSGRCLEEEAAGRGGLRLGRGGRLLTDFEASVDGDAAVSTGLGACSWVSVVRGLSLAGGLVSGDDLGTILGKMVVSLRINVPRMEFTSYSTGW